MAFSGDFYMDISKINLAHEFTLDAMHGCEYPHGRGEYGLVFGIEGEAEYRFCSGEKLSVGAGELLLLAPSAAYSTAIKGKFRHYTVNFEIHEASAGDVLLNRAYRFVRVENPEEYKQTLKKLTTLRISKRAGSDMLVTSCLYELLASLFAELQTREHGSDRYTRLIPAKEYIDSEPTAKISLDRLARLCNMSVTNFRREWTKTYGETPMQYRDRVRLFYAKEYLLSGYYTVGEVAERSGFDDVSYFIRFFKKHVGASPKKFVDREYGD